MMWDYSRLLESGFFAFPYIVPPPENNMSEEDRLDAVMEWLIERRRLFGKELGDGGLKEMNRIFSGRGLWRSPMTRRIRNVFEILYFSK